MSRYLLDSGPLSAFLIGRSEAVDLVSPWIRNREASTSIVVYGEIIEYFKSFPEYNEMRASLVRLLRAVEPYALDFAILERYADIRRSLRPPYGPGLIGDIDTLIAATALEYNLTLVTTDSDFERVPGLNVLRLHLPPRGAGSR